MRRQGLIKKIFSGRTTLFGMAVILLFTLADGQAAIAASPTGPTFGTPVRLPTFKSCGGYEPGIAIDKYGNIFVTAHKQNHCDAVALDPSAPTGVRAQSWMWTSSDGVNFTDMPGIANLPAAADQLDFGDEGVSLVLVVWPLPPCPIARAETRAVATP